MSRRVAIVQSSYIPWRGTFALISSCDCFVFLDSVQFTRRDWRSRNAIRTRDGVAWLSVPVRQKGNYRAPIDAIEIAEADWAKRHLRAIEDAYRRAEAYDATSPVITDIFSRVTAETTLSRVNQNLTAALCAMLSIETALHRDVDLVPRDRLDGATPTDRLVTLARSVGATRYLTGPSARDYLDEAAFHAAGIDVEWMEYGVFSRPYPQTGVGFEPAVSIVDTLFNLGVRGAAALVGDGRHG